MPERAGLWYDFLRSYPIKIYEQRIIGRFVVDFYCHKAKLVIELDGSQHYTDDGIAYDAERTALLNSYELHVIRFSNSVALAQTVVLLNGYSGGNLSDAIL